MASILPNVPYGIPLQDSSGNVPSVWTMFFRSLYTRVGSAAALTNTELASLHSDSVTALQTQVTNLTTTVSTLQSQVTSGFNDLNQGPVL